MATILVVDDRSSNRQLLSTLLTYAGHRIVEAVNGREAWERVSREAPALVITDILMPVMDGFEFTQKLRQHDALRALPVIFHTATFSEPEAHRLAESCGVRTVLPKPCEPQQILEAVQRELGLPMVVVGHAANDDETQGRSHGTLELVSRLVRESDPSRLGILLEALTDLKPERDRDRLVKLFFGAACEMVRSEFAAVGMLDAEGHLAELYTRNLDPADFGGRSPSLMDVLSRRNRSLRSEGAEAGRFVLPAGGAEIRSVLAVPVGTPESALGWMYFLNRVDSDAFDDQDEHALGILAGRLGVFYENARLYEEVQRHAADLRIEAAERRRVTEILRESEERYRATFEHAAVGIAHSDGDSRFTMANPALLEMLGYSLEQLRTMTFPDVKHPEDVPFGLDIRQRMLEGDHAPHEREIRLVRSDGSDIWVNLRTAMVRNASANPEFISVIHDISARKLAEQRVERLSRVQALLGTLNAAQLRIVDREELLQETCRIAVDVGRFLIAWIGLVGGDSAPLRLGASSGGEEAFMRALPLSTTPGDPNFGLPGRALRGRAPEVANDVGTDDRVIMKGECERFGVRSMALLPVSFGGVVLGVLALYSAEAGFFDDEEVAALESLAGDLGFALDSLDKRERLRTLVNYDALTGLANRSLIEERLARQITSNGSEGGDLAVIVADVERFRHVNDSLGRHRGDELLQVLAKRLQSMAPDPAGVARLGGNQFAILLPNAGGATRAARTIYELGTRWLSEPVVLGETEVRVSTKAGIAMFPSDGDDAESLMQKAEAALKRAKDRGDRYLFFMEEMTARIGESLSLENELRSAIEREEFVLHYQPKVDFESRAVLGVEALIRWNHPRRGLVPPGHFIPLLEETGMILDVGAWALRRAVLDHRHWTRLGYEAPRVAVNVSQVQLRHPDFLASLREVMAEGANPRGLDLEITESLLMEDLGASMAKLSAIRDMGIAVAIDDFGTGYSSLAYLSKLPVQALKIDRSFIVGMLQDPDAMTLVQTIISLARAMRLRVVAEGVETEEQARLLRLLRCDEMQGYLISRPLPFPEIAAHFNRRR